RVLQQHVDDRLLVRSGDGRQARPRHLVVFGILPEGGLEATEAEVESPAARAHLEPRAREADGGPIAFARELVDDTSTRIPEAEDLGPLVERLAGRIVPRRSEKVV